jgi:hypothetical protein
VVGREGFFPNLHARFVVAVFTVKDGALVADCADCRAIYENGVSTRKFGWGKGSNMSASTDSPVKESWKRNISMLLSTISILTL